MRSDRDQAKTACGNLQLCAGLEAGIEGATTEDDVTWVASNFSGAAGALGAEVMELRNWLLCFGCASAEHSSTHRYCKKLVTRLMSYFRSI